MGYIPDPAELVNRFVPDKICITICRTLVNRAIPLTVQGFFFSGSSNSSELAAYISISCTLRFKVYNFLLTHLRYSYMTARIFLLT